MTKGDKPREPVTLESLLNGWAAEKRPTAKTIYSGNRVLEQLVDFLGHKDADRLTPDDLLRWKAALLEAGLRTKTIRDSKMANFRLRQCSERSVRFRNSKLMGKSVAN